MTSQAPSLPGRESDDRWRLITDEPCPNDVFDVIAKYYDPVFDRFLIQRFAGCIQVDGVVMWCNPFRKFGDFADLQPIKLVEHGYRPTHWQPFPSPPDATP